ncbi:MAG TPA: 30S ribosomal protein S6 [Planctomycetota bacterium]|nr:30S ribosomal protein S6 [Planctomycetota bacterium]
MRLYEGMFLLDDARCNENFQAVTREVHTILEKAHAEVFTAEKWDERKLCYPISGRTRAVYYLVRFTAPTEALVSIERDCQLNDTILRVLLIRDEQSEKLHKTGLLAVQPGEPGEPIQSLGKRVPTEPPAAAPPAHVGEREAEHGPPSRGARDGRASDRRDAHDAD